MFHKKYLLGVAMLGLSVMTAVVPASAASISNPAQGVYIISNITLPGSEEITLPNLPEISIPCLPEINLPEIPEIPEAPETPETPESPETPETPETPENPETPETPAGAYARKVIELVNIERAKEGLPALAYDATVEKAALVRAKESEVSFSHTRPDGSSFTTALTEQGISYRRAGENIAWGQKTPEEVVNAWMNSAGHRANIMNEAFTKIGVGYYQNAQGVNYWSQLFIN